jgi:Fe2+ or Zn2+ uptake regulation protein
MKPQLAEADLPKNYRLLYDLVQASGPGRHLTMNELYVEAARRQPGIGHSTVYRGLVRLRELGLISEILVPGAPSATYEPVAPAHAHFRCTACERIEDVDYALPRRLLRTLAEKYGFAITGESLALEGRCAACVNAAS